MVSEEKKKKSIKIYRKFVRMTNSGKPKMESYRKLAEEFGMSIDGIRRAVLAGSEYYRQTAGSTPAKNLR